MLINYRRFLAKQISAAKCAACLAALALMLSGGASAALLTYEFEGKVKESNSLFNVGDLFSGSYTFESTASVIPHPDFTLANQSQAIDPNLSGTGWQIDLFSSAIADFSISGTSGNIAVGNDGPFGDRYRVNLGIGSPLPLSLSLISFEIDLQDLFVPPADMLSDGAITTLPNLALAQTAGGIFSINGSAGGCQQCQVEITRLSAASLDIPPVPVPAAAWLFGTALLGLLGIRRNHKNPL